jgi:hypothetical protein
LTKVDIGKWKEAFSVSAIQAARQRPIGEFLVRLYDLLLGFIAFRKRCDDCLNENAAAGKVLLDAAAVFLSDSDLDETLTVMNEFNEIKIS